MGFVYLGKDAKRRTWMMQYFKNGQRIRETSGTDDRKKAERLLHARETDLDRGLPVTAALGKIRFEAAAQALETDYANNDRRSAGAVERRIRLHLQPVFGGWKMADITPAAIKDYTHTRRTEGAANGTVNRELALLKRMFILAIDGGQLVYRPKIKFLVERNARVGFFERDAFEAMRRHLAPALQAVVTFAYLTGWRIDSEVLPLEWRQVDFEADVVVLDAHTTKNGEARAFPLTDDLRALLLAQQTARAAVLKTDHLCPWVFFRLVAKGRRGPKAPKIILRFNKAWASACRDAGVPGRIPHDLRRTAIRNMVRRGVPERVAMQLSGHLTRSVFERYNIVSPGDLREAAGKLGGMVTEATATTAATTEANEAAEASEPRKKSKKFGGAARI